MMFPRGLTFDDVTLVPAYGNDSRDDASVEAWLGRYRFDIPIIAANMDTIAGVRMVVTMGQLGGLGILHRFMSVRENVCAYRLAQSVLRGGAVGVSIGVQEGERERAAALYGVGARLFCVDVAHAHSGRVRQMVGYLKDTYNDLYIIAGNVCTYEGASYLVDAGADAVKIGCGAGSVCTTREIAGVGVPQLSAIMDCARVDRPIIADGGIRKPGDVVKALAAGADMVMLGGMLAGTNEACGGTTYRGMSSVETMKGRLGGRPEWRTAEGISTRVEPKGPVAGVIREIVGGIRSGLSYVGAKSLDELRQKACFMEVSRAAYLEGRPHGREHSVGL